MHVCANVSTMRVDPGHEAGRNGPRQTGALQGSAIHGWACRIAGERHCLAIPFVMSTLKRLSANPVPLCAAWAWEECRSVGRGGWFSTLERRPIADR